MRALIGQPVNELISYRDAARQRSADRASAGHPARPARCRRQAPPGKRPTCRFPAPRYAENRHVDVPETGTQNRSEPKGTGGKELRARRRRARSPRRRRFGPKPPASGGAPFSTPPLPVDTRRVIVRHTAPQAPSRASPRPPPDAPSAPPSPHPDRATAQESPRNAPVRPGERRSCDEGPAPPRAHERPSDDDLRTRRPAFLVAARSASPVPSVEPGRLWRPGGADWLR